VATKYAGSASEVLALNTFIRLQRAASAVEGYLGRHGDFPDRLTESQFGVLEALLHLGPLCHHELGTKILKSKGNITLVIDNLERAGLVRRVHDRNDRRQIRAELTDEGRELITRVFPLRLQSILDAFGVLEPVEQEQLGKLCKKLGTSLKQQGV